MYKGCKGFAFAAFAHDTISYMYYNFQKSKQRGFTMVEIITVISIMAILMGIVLASISEARQNSRDKKRVSDLRIIEFALVLYKEKNSIQYPTGSNMVISTNSSLYTSLLPYLNNPIADPFSGTAGYDYVYDSNFTCTAPGQAVVYANQMEKSKNANSSQVCTHTNSSAGPNAFVIILK